MFHILLPTHPIDSLKVELFFLHPQKPKLRVNILWKKQKSFMYPHSYYETIQDPGEKGLNRTKNRTFKPHKNAIFNRNIIKGLHKSKRINF